MEEYSFFAMLSRMKYINRWGLMNNTKNENISEHSLQVAILAHALVLIQNKYYGTNLNAERAALLGMFHDVTEIITGDMPTPIKYHNEKISSAYKEVETAAKDAIVSKLPDEFKDEYDKILDFEAQEPQLYPFVKAADKLSALIKCIEELRLGNKEFEKAKTSIEKSLSESKIEALKIFTDKYLPAFYLTLDEQ